MAHSGERRRDMAGAGITLAGALIAFAIGQYQGP
jgi:hypothetical protein